MSALILCARRGDFILQEPSSCGCLHGHESFHTLQSDCCRTAECRIVGHLIAFAEHDAAASRVVQSFVLSHKPVEMGLVKILHNNRNKVGLACPIRYSRQDLVPKLGTTSS